MRAVLTIGLIFLLGLPALTATEVHVLEDGSPAKITVLGNGAYMRGQYETAISFYEKALEVDKTYFYALFNLGLTYQQLAITAAGESERGVYFKKAQDHYLEALRLRPENAEVHSNLGIIAFRQQDYSGAITRFQAAVDAAANPREKAGYAYNLGTAYERKDNPNAARKAYEQCLKLDDSHFGALYNLGSLHLQQKNYKTAERLLRQAREVNPRRPEPLLNLAVLSEQRELGDPLPLYNETIQVASAHQPQILTEALWHRARYYQRANIPGVPTKVKMKEDLLAILERDEDFPEANGLLGMYYESLAEYDQAITYLEREVSGEHFDPESDIDLKAHFRLAIIYSEHRRNANKALEHVSAYYRIRPDATGDALRERALILSERPGSQPEQTDGDGDD